MKTWTAVWYAAEMHKAARSIAHLDKPTWEQASALVRAAEDYVNALEKEEEEAREEQGEPK